MINSTIFTHTGGGTRYVLSYLVFAILLLLGFTTNAFANGGGGGGGGGPVIKPTGTQYRCFAKIGASSSTKTQSMGFIGGTKYCIPSPNGENGCKKSWNWSLKNKDDKVTEGGNCNFECKNTATIGADSPINTHSYCVLDSQWDTVAKCVNKTTGEEVGSNECKNDTYGNTYYYKPRCNEKGTTEQCSATLKAMPVSWRFCYDINNSLQRNTGGQSVIYQEFSGGDATIGGGSVKLPCEQSSNPPSGGGADTEPKPTLGNLIIIDWDDSKRTKSFVHTKISGNNADFKIYDSNAHSKLGSGLKSVTCEIVGVPNTKKTAKSSISLSSASVFKYQTQGAFNKSGTYTIQCKGANDDGDTVSDSVDFFVAPHSYEFSNISVSFDNTTSAQSKGGIVTENLLDKPRTIQYNKTYEAKHDNNNWTKKPVIKIDEILSVNLAQVIAYNANKAIDLGVGANSDSGEISVAPKSSAFGITNATATPPTTSPASGACNITPILTQLTAKMTDGTSATLSPILTIKADNALVATMEAEIFDSALQTKIEKQAQGGFCDDKNAFPCPYPARLQLSFDYEIVPASFKTELLDNNNDPLKVLYFGMGSSPAVEATTKLRITALKSANANANNNAATTFSKNCAAENMTINMQLQGAGFSIKILDKDGKDFIIEADKFNNGIADIEAIVKVDKDENVDFTPNMKSEPVFTGDKYPDGFPAKMEFASFPPANTYYPNYEDVKVNPNIPMLILRARINAIDTDNSNLNSKTPDDTKVWYEFQCEYCNIDKVAQITGWNNGKGYTNADRSPTQQGWWIDRTFGKYNQNKITKSEMIKIESTNSNKDIRSVDSSVSDGLQKIQYGSLSLGTHKLNIRHYSNGDKSGDSMPNFLLYNAYWNANVRWNTSAFIYIKGKAADDKRNYGVDTGGAKNTRSGGRTGKY